MKKNLARFTIVTLSIILALLLLAACGGSNNPEPTPEPTPIESTEPTPEPAEPEPLPEPVIDNGIGDLSRIVNACPSEVKEYGSNHVSCNLGNVLYFIVEGDVSNADSLIVSFYASSTNDYQNEAVMKALVETNKEIFYNSQSVTTEILGAGLESVYDGFSEKYLSIQGYNILVKSAPATDGGGGIVTYKITK